MKRHGSPNLKPTPQAGAGTKKAKGSHASQGSTAADAEATGPIAPHLAPGLAPASSSRAAPTTAVPVVGGTSVSDSTVEDNIGSTIALPDRKCGSIPSGGQAAPGVELHTGAATAAEAETKEKEEKAIVVHHEDKDISAIITEAFGPLDSLMFVESVAMCNGDERSLPACYVANIDNSFPNAAYFVLMNLYKASLAKGTDQVQNLSLLPNYKNFTLDKNFLVYGPKKTKVFFLTGLVTYSSVTKGSFQRQLSVAPFTHTFYRACSLIGKKLSAGRLVFQSFMSGLTFASKRNTGGGGISPETPTSKKKEAKAPPADALLPFGNILPWNEDVPCYDGRIYVDLGNIDKMERMPDDELQRGAAVLVLFTLSTYNASSLQKKNFELDKDDKMISLNVQKVIVLADADREGPAGDNINIYKDAKGVTFEL